MCNYRALVASYLARGGKITICRPGAARGALVCAIHGYRYI